MKRLFFFMAIITLMVGHARAEELLENAGFEASKSGLFGTEFTDWTMPVGMATANTTDKLEGTQSLQVSQANQSTNYLEQDLSMSSFQDGDMFELRVCYKVLGNPNSAVLSLDSYWTTTYDGDSDQDADVLKAELEQSSEWKVLTVQTTKPSNATRFYFRLIFGKGMQILFDDFSFRQVEKTDEPDEPTNEPYLVVTPQTLSAISAELGQSVTFPTIHVSQGNLSKATDVYISGTDRTHFSVSQTSVENGETDIVVTYTPTAMGTHSAVLSFDPVETSLFTSISLRASCTDPTKEPVLTISPADLPEFHAVAGQTETAEIIVSSENAIDNISL